MTGPYGIPYEELAMQQKEAEESMPYTMRDVRKALVKLPPKHRHGIIFFLDSGQAEIERLTAGVESHSAALAKAEERVRELEESLRPFAESAAKAEANQVQSERLGMGRMTDDASPGWGIKIRHLKAARAALEGE